MSRKKQHYILCKLQGLYKYIPNPDKPEPRKKLSRDVLKANAAKHESTKKGFPEKSRAFQTSCFRGCPQEFSTRENTNSITKGLTRHLIQ
jgi:hypothetical protein